MTKTSKSNRPLIIGLTGSIGTGKSTAAKILKAFGLPVHNADKAVHDLMKPGGEAVSKITKLFPSARKNKAVDRRKLGQIVFQNPQKLKQLEKIVHPLVEKSEQIFIKQAQAKKKKAVVLEIPLLFETRADKRCDATICISSTKKIQETRVLQRPGMTKEKLKAILKRQMPDPEKRRRADYVVTNNKDIGNTKRQLKLIITKLLKEKNTCAK